MERVYNRMKGHPLMSQAQLNTLVGQCKLILATEEFVVEQMGRLPEDEANDSEQDDQQGAHHHHHHRRHPRRPGSGRARDTTTDIAQLHERREEAKRKTAELQELGWQGRRQCALALCNMAAEVENHRPMIDLGVMPAWLELARRSTSHKRGSVRARITEALMYMSYDLDIAHDIIMSSASGTLVALASSNEDIIRKQCVATLFNLSRVQRCEGALVAVNASQALMVVSLLRSHQPDTQQMAMQAVHNIMTRPRARRQVLMKGIMFGLLKLAGSHNPVTQRVCTLTMYCMSQDAVSRGVLVQSGGIRGIMTVLQRMEYLSSSLRRVTDEEEADVILMAAHAADRAEDHQEEERLEAVRLAQKRLASKGQREAPPTPRNEREFGRDLICTMLTAVLASICKHTNDFSSRLLKDGIVEVLVQLCRQYIHEIRTTSEEQVTATKNKVLALLEAENGVTGGVDPALYDREALLGNCVWGLYRQSTNIRARHRNRIIEGGALKLFVDVLLDESQALMIRQLAQLGVLNVVWSGTHTTEVLDHGVLEALATMSRCGDEKVRMLLMCNNPFVLTVCKFFSSLTECIH